MELYKYSSGESGLKILEGLKLKITPPNEFNDPFEITPSSKFSQTVNGMIEEVQKNPEKNRPVYEEMVKAGEFVGSFESFNTIFPHALSLKFGKYRKLSKEKLAEIDLRTRDTVSQGIGILCLSKHQDNIPMWSYYGNDHRGVVFGLEINKISCNLSGHIGPVKYRKHRVKFDPYDPRFKAHSEALRKVVLKTVFTKNKEWVHEAEFRRIFLLKDLNPGTSENGKPRPYFLDISGDAIKKIIFGCQISPEIEAKIRHELQRRKKTFGHIQLYRCRKHRSKFKLEVISANSLS